MTNKIELPALHSGQLKLLKAPARLNVVRSGRRWGKTIYLSYIAVNASEHNRNFKVGIFTPEYRQLQEIWNFIRKAVDPMVQSSNKMEKSIYLQNGSQVDFWTTMANELEGLGREYHLVLCDEMAFSKNGQMTDIWNKAIKPTMLTTKGTAWIFSTPNGVQEDNFFYQICHDEKMEFKQFHAPTSSNPYVPPEELEKEKQSNDPLVFRQEFLAEFVDWSGQAFFAVPKLLINGQPVATPVKVDNIFAVMDTAVKSGSENDGTAILYCALNELNPSFQPLTILDWDIFQLDGNLIEAKLPEIFNRCEQLAKETQARYGFSRLFIEDANVGSLLIQQGRSKGLPIEKIDNKLLMKGKDERAVSVSQYVYQEKVKINQYAYDKVITYKGSTRNHLLSQVASFRMGDKDGYKRADDLLDVFTYGIAIALGDSKGY
jgi:hypothetical protein